MSHQIPSSFTKYQFTPEEELQAYIFNTLQLQALQTEKALAAEAILALEFDPEKTLKFAQDEAVNKGKIALLDYLLQCHERGIETLRRVQDENQSSPNQNSQ